MTTDPKSLQKFTNSVEDTLLELNKKYPRPDKNATQTEKQTHKMFIINGLLNNSAMEEWAKEDLRNQTWEDNHQLLITVINAKMQNTGQMPTINQLLRDTGLSRQTILKHLKGFRRADFYQDHLQQFRLMTGNVLTKVYGLAMQGDVKAAKVYLDAVGGVSELKEPEAEERDRPANNFIQINNSIKIDQPTFTTLPEAVQRKIAELVLQGMQTSIAQSPGESYTTE